MSSNLEFIFQPEVGVSKLSSVHRERRVRRSEDLQRPNPNLEPILVACEELLELLCCSHPIIVERSVPGCEVLESVLVSLKGLLVLVDVARLEKPRETSHVLSQHAQLWQYWALKKQLYSSSSLEG